MRAGNHEENKMSSHRVMCLVAGSIVFACGLSTAGASLIPIVNPGFEDPATQTFTVGSAPGWSISGNSGGVWNINATPLGVWTVPAPEGNQIGWLSRADGSGAAAMTQTLSDVLAPNTSYTLSGFVGHPAGSSTAVYGVTLFAGGNPVATMSGSGPNGSFQAFSLSFDSTGSSFVGQTLAIQLFSDRPQTGFDDIRLEAILIPTPGAATLIGLGGLMVGRRRR